MAPILQGSVQGGAIFSIIKLQHTKEFPKLHSVLKEQQFNGTIGWKKSGATQGWQDFNHALEVHFEPTE